MLKGAESVCIFSYTQTTTQMLASATVATTSGSPRREDDVARSVARFVQCASVVCSHLSVARLPADTPKDSVAEPQKDETRICQYVHVKLSKYQMLTRFIIESPPHFKEIFRRFVKVSLS